MGSIVWNGDPKPSDLAPNHEPFEGIARFFLGMTLLAAAIVVAYPWLMMRAASVHHRHWPAGSSSLFPLTLACLDLLCIEANFFWFAIFRRLGAKIAERGPESGFLDRIRLNLAISGLLAMMLTLCLTASLAL
jgi:hypothetical protein